jgi:hypothetical protein
VINLHRNLERYLDLPESERMRAGDDAERSDEVGAPPACGGERRS